MYAKRIGIQDKSAESCEHGIAEGRDERERERETELAPEIRPYSKET